MSDYTHLVNQAAAALLARKNVTLTHPPGWVRDGFPLPVKRQKPDVFGSVTQEYRPMAIFEYVSDKLNGVALGERMAERWEDGTMTKAPAADLFGGVKAEPNLFG